MGRVEYMALKADPAAASLMDSDMNELKLAAKKLIHEAPKIGGVHFSFLRWIASFAAMYVASPASSQ